LPPVQLAVPFGDVGQTTPQAPQLLRSVCTLTQVVLPQQVGVAAGQQAPAQTEGLPAGAPGPHWKQGPWLQNAYCAQQCDPPWL
jgi:hypothetical protein